MSHDRYSARASSLRAIHAMSPNSGYSATPSPSFSTLSFPSVGGPSTPAFDQPLMGEEHLTAPRPRLGKLPETQRDQWMSSPSITSDSVVPSPYASSNLIDSCERLHPQLAPATRVTWDVRKIPRRLPHESATWPKLPNIVVAPSFISGLPLVPIAASNGQFVTVRDVCHAIYAVLNQPFDATNIGVLSDTAAYIGIAPTELATMVTDAHRVRTEGDDAAVLEGRKIVDLLVRGHQWAGMVEYAPGCFRMKTPTL